MKKRSKIVYKQRIRSKLYVGYNGDTVKWFAEIKMPFGKLGWSPLWTHCDGMVTKICRKLKISKSQIIEKYNLNRLGKNGDDLLNYWFYTNEEHAMLALEAFAKFFVIINKNKKQYKKVCKVTSVSEKDLFVAQL